MKKSLTRTIIVIGFAVALFGTILDPMISNFGNAAASLFSGTGLYLIVGTVLGTAFVFSKNGTLMNAGFGLCAFAGAAGILMMVQESAYIIFPIGLSIAFVGAVLQFLLYAVIFFGFVKTGDGKNSATGSVIDALLKYKDLEKDEIISEEEFANLKSGTIAAFANEKVSLEDLKKWKKLLDQGVISDVEFAEIKSRIFNK